MKLYCSQGTQTGNEDHFKSRNEEIRNGNEEMGNEEEMTFPFVSRIIQATTTRQQPQVYLERGNLDHMAITAPTYLFIN